MREHPLRGAFLTHLSLIAALASSVSCGGAERPADLASTPATPTPVETPSTQPSNLEVDAPQEGRRTQFDVAFDTSSRLVVEHVRSDGGDDCCDGVRVLLVDRTDPTRRWVLDTIAARYFPYYELNRVAASAVVLCRTGEKGEDGGCVKLFIDPAARRRVNRVEFARGAEVAFADDLEAQRLLGVSDAELHLLRERGLFTPRSGHPGSPPPAFKTHPLPQSTYAEFARARPGRAANGYDSTSVIEEGIGAWQADEGGFWFGKAFYDSEGITGVGGAGFLSADGTYSFLPIPELVNHSVGALLVEPDAVWIGRVGQHEFGDEAGGLLRYDRRTQRTTVRTSIEIIQRIVQVSGAVFLRTDGGLYVLRGQSLVRHRMEPDVRGVMVVHTDTLPN